MFALAPLAYAVDKQHKEAGEQRADQGHQDEEQGADEHGHILVDADEDKGPCYWCSDPGGVERRTWSAKPAMTRPRTPATTMAIHPSGAMAAANTRPPSTMRMGRIIWSRVGETTKILSSANLDHGQGQEAAQ